MNTDPFLPAGSRIHFRALDVNRGWGMTWRVRTKADKIDVYTEPIEGKKWIHGSHHASGESHYALTDKALKLAGESIDRYFGVQPAPFEVSRGIDHLAHIMVEADSLSIDWHERGTPDDVVDVPTVPGSSGVAFDVFRVHQGNAPTKFEQASWVGGAFCGTDCLVIVYARPLEVDESVQVVAADEISKARAAMTEAGHAPPFRVAWIFEDDERPGVQIEADVYIP